MKIYEVLDRDPRSRTLVNEGQARISDALDAPALRELRAELETFVCDGQYARALELILQNFLVQYRAEKRQLSAWISGFFGSGKSHLLKMLGYLWANTEFSDGATARSLVAHLPEDATNSLRELDTLATRSGKKAFTIAGTLLSGNGDQVRMAILSIILKACGQPVHYPQALFCFWLREQGYLEHIRGTVEAAGKEWFAELNNMYVSGLIAKALLTYDPNFAPNEQQARAVLRAQFPQRTADITTDEFIAAARKALAPDGNIPLTILVLDEVQQYIGQSSDRAGVVAEVIEAIQTGMDSRIMLVAAGQSALAGTPQLQKIKDRFRIEVQLSDTDVEAVTRQVLLSKKPKAIDAVKEMLSRNSGEVSKHLQGTRLAEREEDKNTIVSDYPLLPSRRRFWEGCFRVVDMAGTQSQLRSQLRILDDTLKEMAIRDLGAVIPADALYDSIAGNLVNTGVLLGELSDKILKLDNGSEAGKLKKRLCSLIFLINKLPRETGVDSGVRATAKMLADLMVDNLEKDSGPFRKQVEDLLNGMSKDGTLMKVGEEFRLQTTEGAEWDRLFREKAAAARQSDALIASKRTEFIAAAVQQAISKNRINHGEAKVARRLEFYVGLEAPADDLGDIIVWMRDGWNANQNDVVNEARRRGQEDPVIHIFIPRGDADELRASIADEEAAGQTLTLKGNPQSPEGQEARSSMDSKLKNAESCRKALIDRIVDRAMVFQGGGNETYGDSLQAKIDAAAKDSKARRFPRFEDGDHKAGSWELALKRAREGNDQPLVVVDWHKPVEDHPVSREVINTIGNAARGGDILKTLLAAPYGWPQDAIAAVLVALTRSGSLRATVNGQVIQASALDQSKIKTAEFRPEKVRLGAEHKLALRGLYQNVGVSVKSGEEELKANEFLNALIDLGVKAGGPAPLPERPDTKVLEELRTLTGTEQLGKILEQKENFNIWIKQWSGLKQLAEKRLPDWKLMTSLLAHAKGLSIAEEVMADVDIIQMNRTLIDGADQVAPIRVRVATALRASLTALVEATIKAWEDGQRTLSNDGAWNRLDDEAHADILRQVALRQPVRPVVSSDESLLDELDRQNIAGRADALAAISGRIAQALAEAVRRLKPKARSVTVRRATLETEEEVKAWLEAQCEDLLKAIKDGPVIIG